jgi:VWFA-related protein
VRTSFRVVALLSCLSPLAFTQQNPPASTAASSQAPPSSGSGAVITQRPAYNAPVTSSGKGSIQLNVTVTDKSGRVVSGLDQSAFTLLDNNQPAKILSFHAYNGAVQPPPVPVQVIILFDLVDTPFDNVSYARQQVDKFLRQNGGHLAQPVSIYWLTDQGVDVQAEPVLDGNGLADHLEATSGRLRMINRNAGAWGAIERYQFSVKMLTAIAGNEADKPGRKLLIWAGPGWPQLDDPGLNYSDKGQQSLFHQIVDLSTLLRKAHIDLYSVSQGVSGIGTFIYQSYLKEVKKPGQTSPPDITLKVLAVQSGGLVLPPSNDLAGAIDTCVQDAGAYYTISFDPPPADGPNEYHELKVRIATPGLTARTNTGYYNQPLAK